jgi:hypothetical protein
MWPASVARFVDVTVVIVLLIVVVVAAIVVFVVARGRSADSSVDSFRRHIDALGPEARRTTVDQVQSAAGDNRSNDESGDELPGDEDGARGT